MNYMKRILDEARIRPVMFFKDYRLESLHIFMNGYMYRLFQEEDIIPEFYPGFQNYIEEVYNIKTGQHWRKIIDFFADDEREALDRFFQHLDEYTKIDMARKNTEQ